MAKTESKKNGAFLNYVSTKLLHEQTRADGKTFTNVTIPWAASKSGYANVAVNNGQVLDTKSDSAKTILLGDKDKTRKMSICTKKATKNKPAVYKTVEISNAEIAEAYAADRKAYREAQKAEAEA